MILLFVFLACFARRLCATGSFLACFFLEDLEDLEESGGGYQSSALEMVVGWMVLARCEDDAEDSGKAEESGKCGKCVKSSGSCFTHTKSGCGTSSSSVLTWTKGLELADPGPLDVIGSCELNKAPPCGALDRVSLGCMKYEIGLYIVLTLLELR